MYYPPFEVTPTTKTKNWKVMEVKDKNTGKMISIKSHKFNPELHEVPGEKAATEEVATEEVATEEVVTVDINSMKFFELKKYAKEQGVEVTQDMKKDELLKLLNEKS